MRCSRLRAIRVDNGSQLPTSLSAAEGSGRRTSYSTAPGQDHQGTMAGAYTQRLASLSGRDSSAPRRRTGIFPLPRGQRLDGRALAIAALQQVADGRRYAAKSEPVKDEECPCPANWGAGGRGLPRSALFCLVAVSKYRGVRAFPITNPLPSTNTP
jgi:hypothetical protein